MDLSAFVSWETLATFGGAVAATAVIVQFTKDWRPGLPTQLYAYLVALVILLAATGFTGGFTWAAAALCPINALLVATSASGLYTGVKRVKEMAR